MTIEKCIDIDFMEETYNLVAYKSTDAENGPEL